MKLRLICSGAMRSVELNSDDYDYSANGLILRNPTLDCKIGNQEHHIQSTCPVKVAWHQRDLQEVRIECPLMFHSDGKGHSTGRTSITPARKRRGLSIDHPVVPKPPSTGSIVTTPLRKRHNTDTTPPVSTHAEAPTSSQAHPSGIGTKSENGQCPRTERS